MERDHMPIAISIILKIDLQINKKIKNKKPYEYVLLF
jgi:hypothetical protein